MSSDNYIYIEEPKIKNGIYNIFSCMASETVKSYKKKDLNHQKMSLLGKAKTLDEAMIIAEKYEKELESEGSYLEYGITRKLWCK